MPPTPTLLTIPPELLLQIFTHLPPPTLHALSQTSPSLSSFLHTHAPTISNTYILKHFFLSASILKSTHIDGWLVPTHPCILEAEERFFAERALWNAPPSLGLGRALNVNNCCFGNGGSVSSNEEPARIHHLNETTTHILHHHQDLSLSLSLGLSLKLSRPGPHYLSFLERYSGEIVARWSMSTPFPSIPPTPSSVNSTPQPKEQLGVEEEDKRMKHFNFMIGNYCVRKWLGMCEDVFGDGLIYLGEIEKVSKREVLKQRISTVLEKGKEGLKRLRGKMSRRKKEKQMPARMLFGEIESEDEKGGVGGGVEKDCWVRGLLWFYGVSSQLAANIHTRHKSDKSSKVKELKQNALKLVEEFKRETRRLKPKLKRVLGGMRCRGRFELLEG